MNLPRLSYATIPATFGRLSHYRPVQLRQCRDQPPKSPTGTDWYLEQVNNSSTQSGKRQCEKLLLAKMKSVLVVLAVVGCVFAADKTEKGKAPGPQKRLIPADVLRGKLLLTYLCRIGFPNKVPKRGN